MTSLLETSLQRDIEWLLELKDPRADDAAQNIRDALTLLDLRKAHIDYLRSNRATV